MNAIPKQLENSNSCGHKIYESQGEKDIFKIYWQHIAEENRIAYAKCLWLRDCLKRVDSLHDIDRKLEGYRLIQAQLDRT